MFTTEAWLTTVALVHRIASRYHKRHQPYRLRSFSVKHVREYIRFDLADLLR